MQKIRKALGAVAFVLVILFAGAIGKLVGKTTSESLFEGKRESEMNAVLIKAANDLNKYLPMMVDSETRLDSSVGINKMFRYNYTMVNYAAEDVDLHEFVKTMEPMLINSVCTTKEMEVFMNNGIPVTYAYHGKNGKQFTSITVHPAQCNKG